MEVVSMPYKGSKRKLAPKIVDIMLSRHPETEYVYDLFGGGGAVTLELLSRPKIRRVVYNEINTSVVELFKKVLYDGVTEEMYQWVDRTTFHQHKQDSTWFGGLCQVVWSFGNNQRNYLYGADKEELKHILHDIIVNQVDRTEELKRLIGSSFSMPRGNSINERKFELIKMLKTKLSCLNNIELPCNVQNLQVEHLDRLTRLSCIKHKLTPALVILNKSYDEVVIDTPIEKTVLYLDPPYEDTNKYIHGIDYDELWGYIKSSSYTIYVSSYNAPLYEVASWGHKILINAKRPKAVVEKLYCNKVV